MPEQWTPRQQLEATKEVLDTLRSEAPDLDDPTWLWGVVEVNSPLATSFIRQGKAVSDMVETEVQSAEGDMIKFICPRLSLEKAPAYVGWWEFMAATPAGWFRVLVSIGTVLKLARAEIGGTGFEWGPDAERPEDQGAHDA